MNKNGRENGPTYMTKKCPECFTHLPLKVTSCHVCGQKVGEVDSRGMARKPVDWKAYLISVIAVAALGTFIWWAFF